MARWLTAKLSQACTLDCAGHDRGLQTVTVESKLFFSEPLDDEDELDAFMTEMGDPFLLTTISALVVGNGFARMPVTASLTMIISNALVDLGVAVVEGGTLTPEEMQPEIDKAVDVLAVYLKRHTRWAYEQRTTMEAMVEVEEHMDKGGKLS